MNVVLVEPEIHQNVGNVGRTCVGTGTPLHLVGKLGFSLDDKHLKRAGLDYWPRLDLRLHPSFEAFLQTAGADPNLLFFSAEGERDFWSAPYAPETALVFGKESAGLPPSLRARYRDRLYRVPHSKSIRSLNLATCVGVVLYEALRQCTTLKAANG